MINNLLIFNLQQIIHIHSLLHICYWISALLLNGTEIEIKSAIDNPNCVANNIQSDKLFTMQTTAVIRSEDC